MRHHISFIVWFVGLSYIALGLYRGHHADALSPGLHLIGMMAALWVALRLVWLIALRAVRMMLGRTPSLSPSRIHDVLKRKRVMRWRAEPPLRRRWVPRRRDFGLRGTQR